MSPDAQIDWLEERHKRILLALHDAIRRPMGVVPATAEEFFNQQMADEAEKRRKHGTSS